MLKVFFGSEIYSNKLLLLIKNDDCIKYTRNRISIGTD